MPNAKKSDFVTIRFSKNARRRMRETGEDIFYFDSLAWELLLASIGEPFGRGSKMPREAVARAIETRKRRAREKSEARRREQARAWALKTSHKPGPRIWEQLVDRMQPGAWYGSRDLFLMVDGAAGRRSLDFPLRSLERRGMLRRVLNPEWRGNVRNVEPQFLWALTKEGVELQAARISGAGNQDEKRPAGGDRPAELSGDTERR